MSISRIVVASLLLAAMAGATTAAEQPEGLVSAGGHHSMAVRRDGSLWTWGRNYAGQLGIGSTNDTHTPVRVGEDNDWAAVSAGDHHSVALKRDGTLWACGYNRFGQLGNGSFDDAHSPVLVKGDGDWTAFAAGDYHTIGLKRGGSVWTWGCSKRGQLGVGSTPAGHKPVRVEGNKWLVIKVDAVVDVVEDAHSPVRVGTDNDWIAVDAGGYYSVAVKQDGSLWAWGDNRYGQMGIGTRDHELTPVRVGDDNDWAAVYAGVHHVCAAKRDGTLWAWGLNEYDQIPVASDARDVRTPAPAKTQAAWARLSGGWRHTLARKRDGTLWAWGLNNYGQLGNGDTSDVGARVLKGDQHVGVYGKQVANASDTPVPVEGGDDWIAVSAQGHHSIAMKRDGSVWTWGLNWFGQLGLGSTENQPSPVRAAIGDE